MSVGEALREIDDAEIISEAIQRVGISPDVLDGNGEPANVVDALSAIARALNRIAKALDRTHPKGPDNTP